MVHTHLKRLRTLVVHGSSPHGDGIVAPLHRSSTYLLGEPASFDDIRYIRLNNTPTQKAIERTLGALEAGDALMTPSGTAAMYMAFGLFEPGTHLLAAKRLYGGTRKLLDHLAERSNIEASYVDMDQPETWAAALRPNTRGFFIESIANPWMSVPPFEAVIEFCRAHDLTSVIDNTLATPVLFQPRRIGFDVVVHSASKHLNGHSDVVAGVVVSDAARTLKMRRLANRLGICPDPQACYLLQRGVKTLVLRVKAQCESAMQIATMLEAHQNVERVFYPGLESSSYRGRARKYFPAAGTMLSFSPKGGEPAAKRVVAALKYPVEAPSLGGVESLVTRPCTTSHAGLSAAYRKEIGVDDGMIRLSVGIEDVADLIEDLNAALVGG